jgi:glycosyltransferase involved in cell wall biosynthesis
MCRFAAFCEEADPLISGAGGSYGQASADETYIRSHPVGAMEALALYVPVFTRDARGCSEMVRDGVDGLVLCDARVPNFRAAIQLVLDDGGLRQRWSAAALAGRERFSRASFITEQTHIYERLFRTSALPAFSC